jgi:serine/threonine protein kinase
MLDKIMRFLKSPAKLASIVRLLFKEVDVTGQGLDVEGLIRFRHSVGLALGVMDISFGDASRQHHRFDMDGSGYLQEPAAHLLIRMHLFEHCKTLGQYTSGIVVPIKMLSQTGFLIQSELGKGNQSVAHLAKDAEGRLCCIKTYEKSTMSTVDVNALKDEFEVQRCLGKHRNIAVAFDIFQDDQVYYMVQELNIGGDFTTLKQRAADMEIPTSNAWWRGVFQQCFEGLAYLHENALMHCDIKEPNLMLRTDKYDYPEVVIIDFGFVQSSVMDLAVICGTPGYIPPETWNSGRFYPRGDIFAMGVVIMQMILNKVPPHHNPPKCEVLPGGIFTEGVNLLKAVGTVTRTRTPPFNLMAADWPILTQLTRRLLAKDVFRRPCSRQVLQDVWFA